MAVHVYSSSGVVSGGSDPAAWSGTFPAGNPVPPTGWTLVAFHAWASSGGKPTLDSVIYSRVAQAGDTSVTVGTAVIPLSGKLDPSGSLVTAVAGDYMLLQCYGNDQQASPWGVFAVLHIFHATSGSPVTVGSVVAAVNGGTTLVTPGYTPPAGKASGSIAGISPLVGSGVAVYGPGGAQAGSTNNGVTSSVLNQNGQLEPVPSMTLATGLTVSTTLFCTASCYDSTTLVASGIVQRDMAAELERKAVAYPGLSGAVAFRDILAEGGPYNHAWRSPITDQQNAGGGGVSLLS